MRQSIRMLGWTITICTILIFVFLATSVYSLMQMLILDQGIMLEGSSEELADQLFNLLIKEGLLKPAKQEGASGE